MKFSMQTLRRYLITGLLVWMPLAITAWVLVSVVGVLDKSLHILPESWQDTIHSLHIPGLGAIMMLLVLIITGALASNLLGQRLLELWDALLRHTPVVKTIYSSVKQVSDTLLAGNGQAFRQAVLVPYPHQNTWAIAFLTGTVEPAINTQLDGDFVSVYVPTTPNPTSGFMLLVARTDIKPLDMSVDNALKYIISMGVVSPNGQPVPATDAPKQNA